MKKNYVRPTIEIENFEANEYVAACWVVTCTDSKESILTYTKPNTGNSDRDHYFTYHGGTIYVGDFNGHTGETVAGNNIIDQAFWKIVSAIFGTDVKYHHVTVTDGANGNAAKLNPSHPNASA